MVDRVGKAAVFFGARIMKFGPVWFALAAMDGWALGLTKEYAVISARDMRNE
jgi:hypothetical protein